MNAERLIVPYDRLSSRARPRLVRLGACCPSCQGGLGALDWQVSPGALQREVRNARRGAARGTFGALGLSQGAGGAVEGASTGAKVGTVVPVIGTAIGAVVGAIAGYLLSAKHYFNVQNSNAQCQQLMQAWQQYLSIQGHVAGRALGWSTMQQLFHAAVGAGLFPGNDMHLQFHNGTLACAGHGDWVDDFLGINLQGGSVNACGAHNCMADALAKYNASRGSVPAGTADAVYFVDDILLPMNQSASIPWVYNGAQNPQVHQLFYDAADAYLGQNASGTTPYVQYPAAQTGTPTAGAVGAPVAQAPGLPAQTYVAPAQPAPAQPVTVPYVSPASNTVLPLPATAAAQPPAAGTSVVPTDQTQALISSMLAQGQSQQAAYTAALQSLAANGVNTAQPAVQSQVAGAVQAMSAGGGTLTGGGTTTWVLLGLGAVGVMMLGMGKKRR